MKLLMSPASPFVRKVRVVLRETGQLADVEEVETSTSPVATHASLPSANPIGKIPTLVRDDGPALYDSRVITRFLNDRAGANLYPEAQKWEILTLEATADAIMEAAVGVVYELRLRDPAKHDAGWMDAQWAKATTGLTALNTRWMSHLNGPLNIGQIGVACALGYLDLRHDDRNWRAGNDALAAWFEGFAKRESMVDTKP